MNDEGGGASRSTDPAYGTSAATDVSLREFIEMRIQYERRLIQESELRQERALELQAREYDRRLEQLNHEAARLQASVVANVSADTWNAFANTYKEDTARMETRFMAIETFQNKLVGASALALVVVPVIVAVITFLLTRHAATP